MKLTRKQRAILRDQGPFCVAAESDRILNDAGFYPSRTSLEVSCVLLNTVATEPWRVAVARERLLRVARNPSYGQDLDVWRSAVCAAAAEYEYQYQVGRK